MRVYQTHQEECDGRHLDVPVARMLKSLVEEDRNNGQRYQRCEQRHYVASEHKSLLDHVVIADDRHSQQER